MSSQRRWFWLYGLLLTLGLAACKQRTAPAGIAAQLAALPSTQGAQNPAWLKPQQPTLVKFWASWCPLCLSELDDTQSWRRDPAFKAVNVLSVAAPGF